jgi:hypothetical protein
MAWEPCAPSVKYSGAFPLSKEPGGEFMHPVSLERTVFAYVISGSGCFDQNAMHSPPRSQDRDTLIWTKGPKPCLKLQFSSVK